MKKLSQYNKVVKTNGKYIYLNTYSGICVGLNPNEHRVVSAKMNDLIGFKKNYPTIYEKFYKNGFIIDEERNEKEEILFKKRKAVYVDREYRLFLHPTLDCNFNCWYCYEEHPKEVMSEETCLKVKKHLELMTKHISGLHLSWFGGEPLMYFNEIVKPMSLYAMDLMHKKDLSFQNSITTNGYYINEALIEDFKKIKLNTFQITIDGDKEKHDKVRKHYGKPSFEKITQNIINLCKKNKQASIVLRVNYDNSTLKGNPEFLKIFPREIRKRIQINFQRVWQTIDRQSCENSNKSKKNKELMKWIDFANNEGFWIDYTRLRPHCDIGCYVDRYYHLEIDHLGKIYKCTAKGYTEEYEVGKLLNNGDVIFDQKKLAKRFHKMYIENENCYNCLYLPMCGGICSENAMRSNWQDDCTLNYIEVPVDEAIIKQHYFNVKKMLNE